MIEYKSAKPEPKITENIIIDGTKVGEIQATDKGYWATINTSMICVWMSAHGETKEEAILNACEDGRKRAEVLLETAGKIGRALMTREDEIKEATIRG